MEFKGTKGKWIYKPTQSTNGIIDVFRVFDEEKQGFYDSGICPIKNDSSESEFNALLISKAPEMLEMLSLVADVLFDLDKIDFSKRVEQLIKEATELK